MTSITPEQLRFHAAGHIAAAALLYDRGNFEGVRTVMEIVSQFVKSPRVNAPPAIQDMIDRSKETPTSEGFAQLEEWFVHPFNTVIENSR